MCPSTELQGEQTCETFRRPWEPGFDPPPSCRSRSRTNWRLCPPRSGAPAAAFFAAYPAGGGRTDRSRDPGLQRGADGGAGVVRGSPEIAGKAVEVIVVIDGSDDRTAEEARGRRACVRRAGQPRPGADLDARLLAGVQARRGGHRHDRRRRPVRRGEFDRCSSRSSPAAPTSSTAHAGSAPSSRLTRFDMPA